MMKGLERRRLQLSIRNHFFMVQVTKRWQKVPREVVESPFLETSKLLMGVVTDNGLWVVLFEQGVGPDDPQRSLPTPNQPVILWGCSQTLEGCRSSFPSHLTHLCCLLQEVSTRRSATTTAPRTTCPGTTTTSGLVSSAARGV